MFFTKRRNPNVHNSCHSEMVRTVTVTSDLDPGSERKQGLKICDNTFHTHRDFHPSYPIAWVRWGGRSSETRTGVRKGWGWSTKRRTRVRETRTPPDVKDLPRDSSTPLGRWFLHRSTGPVPRLELEKETQTDKNPRLGHPPVRFSRSSRPSAGLRVQPKTVGEKLVRR